MAYPLKGIRVLDLSRVLAGPFAGRMLCDLGADVVKLEPPEGDVTRFWGQKVGGVSGYFNQQNAGETGYFRRSERPARGRVGEKISRAG